MYVAFHFSTLMSMTRTDNQVSFLITKLPSLLLPTFSSVLTTKVTCIGSYIVPHGLFASTKVL